jgi:ribonuclease P protein component
VQRRSGLGPNDGAAVGRIVRSADFERVLRAPTRARTFHFAVHHLADRPNRPARSAAAPELSTAGAPHEGKPVDDSLQLATPSGVWLGAVVPKRHARRAVTRSLLKRQIRAAVARQDRLDDGLWVVRLRAPFAREQFKSAASEALAAAASAELDALLLAATLRRPAAG